jgi:tRNA 2-thiouridine synthesizing protein D
MIFTIVVHSAPYSTEAPASAFRFVKAAIDSGHEIYRLFFFGDGVHSANRLTVVAQDDVNWQRQWDELITQHKLDAVVCVSSAIKRGVVNDSESQRHELDAVSLIDNAQIAGLGQLVDAALQSDKVINFG